MNKKILNYIPIVCFILFLINTFLVVTNRTISFDTAVLTYLTSIRNDTLTNILFFFTKLGNKNFAIIICILLFCLIKNKKNAFLFCFNIGFNTYINKVIKGIIKRNRPNIMPLMKEGGFSYPSGHTVFTISCYLTLFFLILKIDFNKYFKFFICTFLLIATVLIPFSRMYIGVHYPSDIIGGFLLSMTLSSILIKQFD